MKEPLVLEGDVQMWESEGGFAAPTMLVVGRKPDADGLIHSKALDRAIYEWAWGELPTGDRGGSVDSDKITQGYLRITVERIDPPLSYGGTD